MPDTLPNECLIHVLMLAYTPNACLIHSLTRADPGRPGDAGIWQDRIFSIGEAGDVFTYTGWSLFHSMPNGAILLKSSRLPVQIILTILPLLKIHISLRTFKF